MTRCEAGMMVTRWQNLLSMRNGTLRDVVSIADRRDKSQMRQWSEGKRGVRYSTQLCSCALSIYLILEVALVHSRSLRGGVSPSVVISPPFFFQGYNNPTGNSMWISENVINGSYEASNSVCPQAHVREVRADYHAVEVKPGLSSKSRVQFHFSELFSAFFFLSKERKKASFNIITLNFSSMCFIFPKSRL